MFEVIYHPLFGQAGLLDQPKPFFETYEHPIRCLSIWRYLRHKNYFTRDFSNTEIITNPDLDIIFKRPTPLSDADVLRVHTPYFLECVKNFSHFGTGQLGNMVFANEDTYDLALLSAGSVYEALADIFHKRFDQTFSINRPPGHHSNRDSAEGLCVFNNIAVAIEKLKQEDKFKGKIAIIDIDAHYGDGIAKIFYDNPDVLYTSIHEYDFSTFESGSVAEIGADEGRGYNINFPIPFQSDDSYLLRYLDFIKGLLHIYKPEIIIIAAGFDGHWADPIGNLSYTAEGYFKFAQKLKNITKDINNSRICFCLEGGYNPMVVPNLVECCIYPFIKEGEPGFVDSFLKPEVISTNIAKTKNDNLNNPNSQIQLFPYNDDAYPPQRDYFEEIRKQLKKIIKKYWI